MYVRTHKNRSTLSFFHLFMSEASTPSSVLSSSSSSSSAEKKTELLDPTSDEFLMRLCESSAGMYMASSPAEKKMYSDQLLAYKQMYKPVKNERDRHLPACFEIIKNNTKHFQVEREIKDTDASVQAKILTGFYAGCTLEVTWWYAEHYLGVSIIESNKDTTVPRFFEDEGFASVEEVARQLDTIACTTLNLPSFPKGRSNDSAP